MIFNTHSNLIGRHAFLGASKYHWINYDEDKLDRAYIDSLAKFRGTELHQLAMDHIRLGIKMGNGKKTLNLYVNETIGFRMVPEQVLYYSDNCFGTPDAISFRKKAGRFLLRISDLKTGITQASEKQLEVYTALFCLEYDQKPHEIDIELRIYQNDEVRLYIPDPDTILHIMDKIKMFDKRINTIREEAMS